jgi:hypothetical protein
VEEIAATPGVGREVARAVHERLTGAAASSGPAYAVDERRVSA